MGIRGQPAMEEKCHLRFNGWDKAARNENQVTKSEPGLEGSCGTHSTPSPCCDAEARAYSETG